MSVRASGAWRRIAAACAAAGLFASCGPQPPLRIGFLGGLASQGSDVSEDGRNGAQLAVEEINRQGGVRGRLLELVVREIGHHEAASQAAAQALQSARVVATVGPFTSTQAVAMLPWADAAHMLLLSPTVNASELVGRDDQLIRLNGALADSAQAFAAMLVARGQRRIAVAFDEVNHAYSRHWLPALREHLQALGGEVVVQVGFAPGAALSYAGLAQALVVSAPDGVMFICSGASAARLAQQLRKQGSKVPLAATEWAATDSLIEMGASAVEELVTAHPYDPADRSLPYQDFRKRYQERHGRAPGFGALGAHDAVSVLAQALTRAEPGEAAKEAVLRHGPYQGLQGPIVFDRFGDTRRTLHFIQVRDGAFAPLR